MIVASNILHETLDSRQIVWFHLTSNGDYFYFIISTAREPFHLTQGSSSPRPAHVTALVFYYLFHISSESTDRGEDEGKDVMVATN